LRIGKSSFAAYKRGGAWRTPRRVRQHVNHGRKDVGQSVGGRASRGGSKTACTAPFANPIRPRTLFYVVAPLSSHRKSSYKIQWPMARSRKYSISDDRCQRMTNLDSGASGVSPTSCALKAHAK
jgi:hypothetical protein